MYDALGRIICLHRAVDHISDRNPQQELLTSVGFTAYKINCGHDTVNFEYCI